MRVGSLFTGYGGIELGLRAAAVEVDLRWFAETDVVSKVHGDQAPNLGDVRAVDWSDVERVDLLTAGFPCQPVSAAGRQRGEADDRWMWPEVRRTLVELRPAQLLIENVRNLVSLRKGELWSGILADLTGLGYDVRWLTLGACHIGAAHHRHRVFALATFADVVEYRGEVERVDTLPCGVRGVRLLPSPQARDGEGRGEGDARYWAARLARRRRQGRPLGAAVVTQWAEFAEAVARHEAMYGPAPAPTEPNRNGAPRLAPAFAEWLMCLPAGHVTNVPDRRDALKAIGNGVCPPQLAAAWRLLTGGAV